MAHASTCGFDEGFWGLTAHGLGFLGARVKYRALMRIAQGVHLSVGHIPIPHKIQHGQSQQIGI